MWGFVLTKKIIRNFDRNMHIDIKNIFGYIKTTPTQYRRREKVNGDKEVNFT